MQYGIGDLIIIELALANYFKDIDVSLFASKQIQQTIATTEYLISQIQTAHVTQGGNKLQPDNNKPTNK